MDQETLDKISLLINSMMASHYMRSYYLKIGDIDGVGFYRDKIEKVKDDMRELGIKFAGDPDFPGRV